MVDMNYDYLWETYQKERQTNQLLALPKSFYSDAKAYIASIGSVNPTSTGTKSNSSSLLNDIFEKRRQKILIYAAYGKPMPEPIDDSELDFYNKLLDMIRVNKLNAPNHSAAGKAFLRSLRDSPEFILPSGGKLGPLRKGQRFELSDKSDIEFLLGNAICEYVSE